MWVCVAGYQLDFFLVACMLLSPESILTHTHIHSHTHIHTNRDYRFDISESPFGGGGRRRPTHTQTDHSLMTFRGHRVARTLIQAVFSPLELTGGRYVVCGSAGGKVYVYDTLTGAAAGERERHTHTQGGGRGTGGVEVKPSEVLSFHVDCTRTVAFAPAVDLMVSAGWDGRLGLWRSC